MLWPMLITLALVKLVAAFLMLWLPFRTDSAVVARDDRPRSQGAEGKDGGSKVDTTHKPATPHPRRPWPRRPRRGPHGSPSPGAPPRVRTCSQRLCARARRVRAN